MMGRLARYVIEGHPRHAHVREQPPQRVLIQQVKVVGVVVGLGGHREHDEPPGDPHGLGQGLGDGRDVLQDLQQGHHVKRACWEVELRGVHLMHRQGVDPAQPHGLDIP